MPDKAIRHWIALCETEEYDLPPDAMIDAFYDELERSALHGRVTVSLQPDPDSPDDTVELSYIGTKKGQRQQGLASSAMAMLTALADRYDVVLRLGVAHDADGHDNGLTRDELEVWYRGWGFEGGETMRRLPEDPR